MTKRKRTKEQTTIYKTLLRKLKIEQHEPTKNSCAPEVFALPVPRVTPLVHKSVLLIQNNIKCISMQKYIIHTRYERYKNS
jgi:hypothetical protein